MKLLVNEQHIDSIMHGATIKVINCLVYYKSVFRNFRTNTIFKTLNEVNFFSQKITLCSPNNSD